MWFAYLLLCKDKSIYTGITNNLERRLRLHKSGRGGKYTRARKAVKFLHTEQLKTKNQALRRELEIKSLPRKEKMALGLKLNKQNQNYSM